MTVQRRPVCWIIVGPNGAGKTTFAMSYLPQIADCHVFVNAGLIAAGLAPLAPEGRAVAAGRVFLGEISRNISARRDFGFETTLAGLAHCRWITRLQEKGWRVELLYLALPSIEMAKLRVAERVRQGGHNIPQADIERRFCRSLDNFLEECSFMADRAVCYLNSGTRPRVVFAQWGGERAVLEPAIQGDLQRMRDHGRTR